MNLGCCDLVLSIQNYVRENIFVQGVVLGWIWALIGFPNGPMCVIQGFVG